MTKEVIIVVLVMALIYLAYQQNNSIPAPNNSAEIKRLEQEVFRYQTLYQKRVAKDLEVDQTKKISQLNTEKEELEKKYQDYTKQSEKKQQKLIQQLTLYQQKIKDQETALINLAKQKIKNQKEASQLLSELETKWSEKEIERDQKQKENEQKWEKELDSLKDQQIEDKKIHQELRRQIDSLELNLTQEKQLSKSQQEEYQRQTRNLQAILNKPTAEMGTQTDLTAEQITQMEKDLADKSTKIAELTKEQNELTNQITQKATEIEQLKKQLENSKRNEDEQALWEPFFGNPPSFSYIKGFIEEQDIFLQTGNYPLNSAFLNKSDYPKSFDPSKLRLEYQQLVLTLRSQIKSWTHYFIKMGELTSKNQELTQLQTKYDMEVRTKEELLKFLNCYRALPFIPIVLGSPMNDDEELMNKFFQQHNDGFWRRIIVVVKNYLASTTTKLTISPYMNLCGGIDFISPNNHYLTNLSKGTELVIKADKINSLWNFSKNSYINNTFDGIKLDKVSLNYFPANSEGNSFFNVLNGDGSGKDVIPQ